MGFEIVYGTTTQDTGVAVTDQGDQVMIPDTPNRAYAWLRADPANTGRIYIRFDPTGDAVFGRGEYLMPGEIYELLPDINLYTGPVRAITAVGTSEILNWYQGT